jgi:signal transduction histidine kinase
VDQPAPAAAGLRHRLLSGITDASADLGFDPDVEFDGPVDAIDDRVAEHLLLVVREVLRAIAEHAQAHHVRVTVVRNGEVRLTISDDGGSILESPVVVLRLRDRARALGGDMTVDRQPSGGSSLTCRLPSQTA